MSKRPEMHLPDQWPSYYSRAKGVDIWDFDGNHFIDMGFNGIGSCILGVGDPDVDAAVLAAIKAGNMSTLNCPEEVELAELLCELHPWADMVRYARGGGEALSIAVRIARAYTGKDKIAFNGYHGWHDWYLAANLAEESALDGHLLPGLDPAGVPRGLLGTAMPFRYNHLEELEDIVKRCGRDLAAIVIEPVRRNEPVAGYLEGMRKLSDKTGAILIVDEVSSGFRLNTGGVHLLYGLEPDMAVFAKAMSNGYPMAAIIGKSRVMQAAQSTFISSTYWTERIGPAAAIATIRKHLRENVASRLIETGKNIQEGWRKAADQAGLKVNIDGMLPVSHLGFQYNDHQALHTLFTQLMLDKGFLAAKAFYATYAHKPSHVASYLSAVAEVFEQLCEAVKHEKVLEMLKGPVAHSGFHRLT
ncbi:MAG: aminotransferase class III-fold pyridoxal phosphate-dependent enzyme [Syntrophaceae bacterium]|nr:aminotransferase class III-fold pyridoxal phosphate-dependent enzyme [Syntrophaceae bacterium]